MSAGADAKGSGPAPASGFGRWTRLGLALQVSLLAALAVVGAVLAIDAAEWRPIRVRADLTNVGRNTLDPATVAMLRDLDGKLEIDVFFDPQPEPFRAVVNQVHERLNTFLELVQGASDRVVVRHWSLSDVVAARARQAELGYEEAALHVAVTRGKRTKVLGMFEEISTVDWGNPNLKGEERFVPPTLELFSAEEALVHAVAEVSESPHVVFSSGHREPSLADTGRSGLSRLKELLERDGFEIDEWDSRSEGPIPADTDVLAIVAPREPLGENTLEHVARWVNAGGRLLFVLSSPYSEEPGTVYELARRFGMVPLDGIVCMPVLNAAGQLVEGVPVCGDLGIGRSGMSPEHPVTRSIWNAKLRLRFLHSRSFERGESRPGGTLLDLVSSGEGSWRDLPDASGFGNFALDQARERVGRYLLAMAAKFPGASPGDAGDAGDAGDDAPGDAPDARVLGLASDEVLGNNLFEQNHDLALNAFNWLAEREARIRVTPRDPRLSLLEVQRGTNLLRFEQFGWLGLSGLCVLAGALTAWRRRK